MICTELSQCPGRIGGSFRDPSGYVFRHDERIFRAIDQGCCDTLQALKRKSTLARLISDGLVVPTEFVRDETLLGELSLAHPAFTHFLEHEPIATVTYPYEWSISMLADAAVLTLDLQLRLLEDDCSLKDATAFNVQFVGSAPTFIDLSSIERPTRLDLWFAMGQFNRMFLFPLLLCRDLGWDLRSYFLGCPQGRDVEQVVRAFGRLGRWRPGLLLDVTLPWLLGRHAQRVRGSGRQLVERPSRNKDAQRLNLRRLRSKVLALAKAYRPQGIWSDYTKICNYEQDAEGDKKDQVRRLLELSRPGRVLDLGCNTGAYSVLAAECGAQVVAIDQDHDAVEILYRRLHGTSAAITPLVIDLTNPSPAIGYRNEERARFTDRVQADCVLALALLHHLLVSGNLSLPAARDMLTDLTSRDLVLEFVPTDDSMFRRLTKFRVDLYGGVTLEHCCQVFSRRFTILERVPIRDSKRTLLWLRKR